MIHAVTPSFFLPDLCPETTQPPSSSLMAELGRQKGEVTEPMEPSGEKALESSTSLGSAGQFEWNQPTREL